VLQLRRGGGARGDTPLDEPPEPAVVGRVRHDLPRVHEGILSIGVIHRAWCLPETRHRSITAAYDRAMRIYDGAPRREYEEVLRSLGATIDGAGIRHFLLLETNAGFLLRGLTVEAHPQSAEHTLIQDDDARRPEPRPRGRWQGASAPTGSTRDKFLPTHDFLAVMPGGADAAARLTLAGGHRLPTNSSRLEEP
jgi:hypothetical protein